MWRKSSYSGSPDNECVELAVTPDGPWVRDSKQPDGPIATFSAEAWGTFVQRFRRPGA
ncbi:DUF397 domain-containing protein [Streptomyces silvensis]|uniref:DUF397 domain-containing protein n=1 Tax=Streptomyces silvensis TaxID=1765722 RepID=UPI00099ED525|nr:DUF397 domain-containing protein [Streptomyces silvensis]